MLVLFTLLIFDMTNDDLKSAGEALLAKEIIGIDPGSNGAIYRYHPRDPDEVIRMPRKFEDMVDYFRYQAEICTLPLVLIEAQNLRRGDKDGKQFGIEKLLRNYTELISALKVSGLPFIRVHPITWQRYLRIYQPGEDRDTRKRRFRDIAPSYNSMIKATLWNCDALLIAYFGKTKVTLDPLWVIQNIEKPKENKIRFNTK